VQAKNGWGRPLMRIGVLAPPWASVPPRRYGGGVETVVNHLAMGYQKAGHEVRLFTTGDSTCPVPREHLYEVAEDEVSGSTVTELVHVLAAYEALADCDLVHDHTIVGPLLAPQPVVTTAHCLLEGGGARLYGRISTSAIIVAVSEAQVVPGVPVARVIHHGVDAEQFPVGKGDGGYLLFLGRMSSEKGAHRALEAAWKAGARMMLAGRVRDPAERWYFERYVAPYLNDQLRFVGEVSHEEKIELLSGARALLFPIRWNEPFGIVMLEALACATPVFAFAEGAAPEVVEQGRTGFLCRDEDHMAEAIGRVEELDRAACRAAVEGHFSAARMVEEYLELFAQLVAEPGASEQRSLRDFEYADDLRPEIRSSSSGSGW
jgi:glycosyltransferase involved in cell wall biosynthesis